MMDCKSLAFEPPSLMFRLSPRSVATKHETLMEQLRRATPASVDSATNLVMPTPFSVALSTGGLSRNWCLGVSEVSASSDKDAQRRRISGCVEAEDDARGVESRRDTVIISATDH
ncbi:MAG: hypothetical protein BMS9Abin20_0496 [Acidimicrobiia bacterium]|nr:MAG: hypothetical protein BMS9Abin20_0496 [Acidimicrobiia bacterium]